MTRHFTEDANAISEQASRHAIRLGHPYLGGEHFLLALSAASQPAGAVLREHGVTPERTEAEIVRLSGGGLFGDLDRDALAAVGVDVDAVRATTEASFGRETLTGAARAAHPKPRWFDLRPIGGAWPDGVFLPHGPRRRAGPHRRHPPGTGQGRHPARGRRGPRPGYPRRQRGAGAPGSGGARRVRRGIEHRDPGPLPVGQLTRWPPSGKGQTGRPGWWRARQPYAPRRDGR